MSDGLWVGLRCVWKHRPRGGYGFVVRVPVTIRKLHGKMATIDVEKTGRTVAVSRTSLSSPPTMIGVGLSAAIEPLPKRAVTRVYLVEFCGVQGFVSATSHARAKRRAMISAQEGGYWSPGKSLKGLRCRLADYVPPDAAVING